MEKKQHPYRMHGDVGKEQGSSVLEVSEAKNVRFTISLNRVNHSKEWDAKPLI